MTLLTEPLAFVPSLPSGLAAGMPVTAGTLAMAQALAAQRLVFDQLAAQAELLAEMAERITACLAAGGKLLIAGEGGAMTVAGHLAGRLSGRTAAGARRPLAVVALATDGASWCADDRHALYARQVQGLGRPGDALLVLNTPGEVSAASPSGLLLPALAAAREEGMATLGVIGMPRVGADGHAAEGSEAAAAIRRACHLSVQLPQADVQRQQEAQLFLGHVLCGLVEVGLGLI